MNARFTVLALFLIGCGDGFAHSTEESIKKQFPDAMLVSSSWNFVREGDKRYFPFIKDKGTLIGHGYSVPVGSKTDGSRALHGEGRWVYYYGNNNDQGPRLAIGNKRNNKRDGVWEFWHRDGKLRAKGRFIDGEMDSEWRVWNEHGIVETEYTGVFKVGKRVSDLTAKSG